MNLTTKISKRIHSLFKVREPAEWGRVSSADLLSVPGMGKKTLNQLRLYLAHRAINLRGDNPPAYWIETLASEEIDPQGVCPFTIVIDSNETYPFTFESQTDSDGKTISVPTVRRPLYLSGLGDYTIDGMEDLIQIERKAEDLYSSLSDRRDIFAAEVERLNDLCDFAAIICELPRSTITTDNHNYGARGKSIMATVSSWRVRFPGVHIIFADGRWDAEQECFRLLSGYWWRRQRELSEHVNRDILDDVFN